MVCKHWVRRYLGIAMYLDYIWLIVENGSMSVKYFQVQLEVSSFEVSHREGSVPAYSEQASRL
jgi:hypothetical protein